MTPLACALLGSAATVGLLCVAYVIHRAADGFSSRRLLGPVRWGSLSQDEQIRASRYYRAAQEFASAFDGDGDEVAKRWLLAFYDAVLTRRQAEAAETAKRWIQ